MGKTKKVVEFISKLDGGTKISVRNLAKELEVSEGTAYKAIKLAEQKNLVSTKPRAGTVRLDHDVLSDVRAVTLSDEIKRLGLNILAGEDYCDVPIGRLVIGDGSLEQFKECVMSTGENALCLIGDRPDLLFFAASHGVNIIVTGGAHPGEGLLSTSRDSGAVVLSSAQDSSSVLSLLRSTGKSIRHLTDFDMANRWMRSAPYLYHDDLVADWHNIYSSFFSLASTCAVVDENLHICRSIDAGRALTAAPSTKIYSLSSDEDFILTVDEQTPMHEIAEKMIANKTLIAYVVREKTLFGVITANDVLRYYQYNPNSSYGSAHIPTLELLNSSPHRAVYTTRLEASKKMSTDALFGIMSVAAKTFCRNYYDEECSLASGAFFSKFAAMSGEVMVSCEIMQILSSGMIFEVEIYDEEKTCCRCVITATVGTDNNMQQDFPKEVG